MKRPKTHARASKVNPCEAIISMQTIPVNPLFQRYPTSGR
jgi:hypothetical protein